MPATLSGIVAILQIFFASNPAVEEVITLLEQIGPALAAEKAGTAFSLSFPIALNGNKGTASFGWSPTVPPTA
jgi:hypothetical protein